MHFKTSFSRRRRDDVAKTAPFSRIAYHFSTLRRNEPYSGGIGLVDYVQFDTQPLTLSSFGILQIKQFLCNNTIIFIEISDYNLQ